MAVLEGVQTYARYSTGVVTAENTYLMYSKAERWNGTSPAVLAFHGATTSETWCTPIQGSGANHSYLQKLASKGYIVVSGMFSSDAWGNAAGTSGVLEAYNWTQANGAKTGKVGLYAGSMGVSVACNFWLSNQAKVGAYCFIVPAANLGNVYTDNASLQASMDAAYAGSYALNGTTHSPHQMTLPTTCPGVVWYASDDTVIRTADSTSFAAQLGVAAVDIGPGSHSALTNGRGDFTSMASLFDRGLR